MGMTVRRQRDTQTPRVFMHKVADIRGGVSVKSSELGGDWLSEGAVLSKPENGICHVVKTAEVKTSVGAAEKTINVKKGSLFNVGDFILSEVGSKAVKITAIDKTSKDKDIITIDTALGVVNAGVVLAEAAAASTDASALKYEPFALVGTGKPIMPNDNINTDAWVIGVTKGNALPTFFAEKLKGIINY